MVILIGFITFNAVPTVTKPAEPTTSSSSSSSSSICEDGCHDNPVTQDDVSSKEVSIGIPTDMDLRDDEVRIRKQKRKSLGEENGGEDAAGVRYSTKMWTATREALKKIIFKLIIIELGFFFLVCNTYTSLILYFVRHKLFLIFDQ